MQKKEEHTYLGYFLELVLCLDVLIYKDLGISLTILTN